MISFDELVLGPCMETFGEINQGFPAVMYTPRVGGHIPVGSFAINGIFDPMSVEIQMKNGEPTTVHFPVLGCKISDFPNPPSNWNLLQGDMISARGKNYTIREAKDDGHGGLKFYLNNNVLA